MVRETKLYDILGVAPDATDAQIRSAYKRLAMRYHPDKNQGNPDAEEKFKQGSHAQEILLDSQKRQTYDSFGEAGLQGNGNADGGGMAAEDLFAQFFGGRGSNGFPGMGQPAPQKARTISHVHKVSLEDMYRGKISKLALQRSVICPKCDGRGGKEGAVRKCTGCDGRGMKMMMRQMGPMIQRFQTVCPDCEGEGEIIRDKDRCKQCNGKKTVIERKILHVHVDKGIKNGTKIDFRGEGDRLPDCEPGDVVFEIEQKPHPRFKRKNDDLFYETAIDLSTALAGGTIYIEHLDDRWLSLNILPGEMIVPNAVKVVRGQGMPSYRHHDCGNLYIQFNVKFPERLGDETGVLSPEDRAALQRILAFTVTSQPKPPPDAIVEDEPLEDFEPEKEAARAHGQAAVDDDDDDEHMHTGGERVQCASQ